MKPAFAKFVFIAGSIAAFAGSAYALPLPVNPFAEANKSEVRETSWFVGNMEAARDEAVMWEAIVAYPYAVTPQDDNDVAYMSVARGEAAFHWAVPGEAAPGVRV